MLFQNITQEGLMVFLITSITQLSKGYWKESINSQAILWPIMMAIAQIACLDKTILYLFPCWVFNWILTQKQNLIKSLLFFLSQITGAFLGYFLTGFLIDQDQVLQIDIQQIDFSIQKRKQTWYFLQLCFLTAIVFLDNLIVKNAGKQREYYIFSLSVVIFLIVTYCPNSIFSLDGFWGCFKHSKASQMIQNYLVYIGLNLLSVGLGYFFYLGVGFYIENKYINKYLSAK